MFNSESLKELLVSDSDTPCVSIYQPTHRQHPDNQQDPIRFRNLIKQAAASLHEGYSRELIDSVLTRFHRLAEDANFWNHTADGLAVFGSAGLFRKVRLQRPVPELAIVAGSFHIKPLLRILQSAERFHVLSVNRRDIRLFEGNRDALDEIELAAEVPRTATDVLGDELDEPEGLAHSYGTGPAAAGAGSNRGAGGPKTGGMRHGHGSKKDVIDQQTERFFRAVDRAISEGYSKPSGLPLILAALPEYHTPFRAVSHNAQLVDAGIEINPDALPLDELRQRAWQVMQPEYRRRLVAWVERFGAARAAAMGDDRLHEVAAAAVAGRVETLLLEADRQLPGSLNLSTGAVQADRLDNPAIDDVLDDLAEQVLKMGGQVIVAPAAQMPSTTGLAAIYRF